MDHEAILELMGRLDDIRDDISMAPETPISDAVLWLCEVVAEIVAAQHGR